jgi:hypothetical protein
MSSLETVAYDSALRSLDEQERVVDELRARTGLVLAASFLGRSAFAGGPPALLGLALAAFAVSIGTGVYVLLPKSTFVFALTGRGGVRRPLRVQGGTRGGSPASRIRPSTHSGERMTRHSRSC